MTRHRMRPRSDSPAARSGRERRGLIAVIFLVVLLLVSLTMASLVRAMLTQRELVRSGSIRVQADWLAQSALNRAAARLKAEPAWSGETWNLTAEELRQTNAAAITIEVRKDESRSTRRQVRVTVVSPPEGPPRVRLQRTYAVDLPNPSTGS